jgi:hypothetical protein
MNRILTFVALALVGSGAPACSGSGSTLVNNSGDATTSDAAGDAALEATLSDAALEASLGDATSEETGPDAGAVGASDATSDSPGSSEGGVVQDDAGPYIGSMPAPTTTALLRFANWSPDSPPADFCIAPHGTGSFLGPIVAGLSVASDSDAGADGVPFPFASAYTVVSPGAYDVRIVVGGTPICAVAIHPDTPLPALAAGGAETVALIGELQPAVTGDYKLHVTVFPDDVSASGAIGLRVINAAAGMSLIDFGTGSLATTFLSIFRGVPVGQVGLPSGAWIPFLVDAKGYLSSSALASVVLSAHPTGGAADAVVTPTVVSVASGALVTFVVAGSGSSPSATLVQCIDNAGTASPFAACTVLSTSAAMAGM